MSPAAGVSPTAQFGQMASFPVAAIAPMTLLTMPVFKEEGAVTTD